MPGLSSGNQWKSTPWSIDALGRSRVDGLPDTTGEKTISTIADDQTAVDAEQRALRC